MKPKLNRCSVCCTAAHLADLGSMPTGCVLILTVGCKNVPHFLLR